MANSTEQLEILKDDLPPIFKTWARLYWFVGIFLVFEIIVFYLITIFYK